MVYTSDTIIALLDKKPLEDADKEKIVNFFTFGENASHPTYKYNFGVNIISHVLSLFMRKLQDLKSEVKDIPFDIQKNTNKILSNLSTDETINFTKDDIKKMLENGNGPILLQIYVKLLKGFFKLFKLSLYERVFENKDISAELIDYYHVLVQVAKDLSEKQDIPPKTQVAIQHIVGQTDCKPCEEKLKLCDINLAVLKKQLTSTTKANTASQNVARKKEAAEKTRISTELERYKSWITKNIEGLGELKSLADKQGNQVILDEINRVIMNQATLLDDLNLNLTDLPLQELQNLQKRLIDSLSIAKKAIDNGNEDLKGSVRVIVKMRGGLPETYDKEYTKLDTQNRTVTYVCNEDAKTITFPNSKDKKPQAIRQITPVEFYAVFDESKSNLDMYCGDQTKFIINKTDKTKITLQDGVSPTTLPPCLYTTFKQVEDGYSIVLFGNGYSGSGKTYSLLGSDTEPGVLQYGLKNLQNVQSINLYNIFELYYNYYDVEDKPPNRFNPTDASTILGRIHRLYGNVDFQNRQINENIKFEQFVKEQDPNFVLSGNPDSINMLIKIINSYRSKQEHKRVKITPNNPESSRSHLFIVFEIEFQNSKGYITIVDAAGRENPLNIYNSLFNNDTLQFTSLLNLPEVRQLYMFPTAENTTSMNNLLDTIKKSFKIKSRNKKAEDQLYYTYNDTFWESTKTEQQKQEVLRKYFLKASVESEPDVKDNIEILLEGFYINESLNHLKYFFKSKLPPPNTFTPTYFVNPDRIEISQYQPNKFYSNPNNDKNNCMMIPVLEYLDTLGKQTKPTKFVMICAIRPDKCKPNIDTLKFAEEISITKTTSTMP